MRKTKDTSPTPVRQADSSIRQVLDSLRRVVRVLRLASREAERRVGLSAAQLFVLQKLAEAPSLSVNELAERTHTHQSSVSVVAQRLVDGGLVLRLRSEQDARQLRLSVTAEGRAALETAPAAAQEQLIDALQRMPATRVRQLAGNLRDMLDLLGIAEAPATMLFEDDSDASTSRKKSNRKARANG